MGFLFSGNELGMGKAGGNLPRMLCWLLKHIQEPMHLSYISLLNFSWMFFSPLSS